ncbi:hypothetical protein pb186bvf_013105 [Paramecium bursaria]
MKFLLIIFLALSQSLLVPQEIQEIEEIELNPIPTEVLFGFDGGDSDTQQQQYYDFDGKLLNGPEQQTFISTDAPNDIIQDQDIIEAFDVEIKVDPIENQNRDLSPQEVVEKEVIEELKVEEQVTESQNQEQTEQLNTDVQAQDNVQQEQLLNLDNQQEIQPNQLKSDNLQQEQLIHFDKQDAIQTDQLKTDDGVKQEQLIYNQDVIQDQANSINDFENSFPVDMQDDNQDQQQEQIDGQFTSASFEMPMKVDTLYDSLGNQIDNPEGQKTYLEVDTSEVDQKKADRVIDVPNKDCIIIYSQCNFKGAQLEVCDSLKQIENFQHQIQSIHIPDGEKLTIYDQENYEGSSTTYQESTSCLLHPISLTQLFASNNKLSRNLRLRK